MLFPFIFVLSVSISLRVFMVHMLLLETRTRVILGEWIGGVLVDINEVKIAESAEEKLPEC